MDVGLVRQVNIDQEMRDAYLDYAMSVIVARALPDARDGLKPVHRRILYAMYDMGLRASTPYKKSARIVGEVLGKYHPHGDASVYDAMVRMAQDFSMRYELVDGQGNFGSVDGDAAAAMRYTEARMASFGMELLTDIDKDTVDFGENFDGSLTEPTVMPASVPNLLVNGASGIAVGMSTSIPPHNLGEVCDAVIYMLENWEQYAEISVHDLMQFIKGPDFPTAGIVYTGESEHGEDGLVSAYATGRGKVTMRAKAHIEELGRGRSRIVITEIPFQVNKSSLIERIVDVVQDGRIEGLVDLRDESDRHGLRIVAEIGRQADPSEVLNALFKLTPLQTTFSIIMLALVDGEPRMLSIKQALKAFVEHRLEIIRRRSEHDLARAKDRAHILEGLLVAIEHIDRVIQIIRESSNTDAAHANLRAEFALSDLQATAILDMQLRRLAALESKKLQDELNEKLQLIRDLTTLLSSAQLMRLEVAREMKIIRESYADQRRTLVVRGLPGEVSVSDLMESQEDTWVTLTVDGRVSQPVEAQAPKITASMKTAPFRVMGSNPSDILYFVTERGNCATILTSQVPKVMEIDQGTPYWKLVDLREDEPVAQIISIPSRLETGYLFFVTEHGEVKRLRLEDLPGLRGNAFKVFDVEEGDRILWVFLVQDDEKAMLVTRQAQAIQFSIDEVRPTGLSAGGMRGIKIADQDDRVIGAGIVRGEAQVWVVTEEGVGKRSPAEEYPVQGRAGGGVRTLRFPPGNDQGLAAAIIASQEAEIIVLTNKWTAKRTPMKKTPVTKRDYKGDLAVSLAKGERVASAFLMEPRVAVNGTSGENG